MVCYCVEICRGEFRRASLRKIHFENFLRSKHYNEPNVVTYMYTIILETPEAIKFEPWTPTTLMEHPQETIQTKSPEKEKEDGGAWQTVSKNKKHVEGDISQVCYCNKDLDSLITNNFKIKKN